MNREITALITDDEAYMRTFMKLLLMGLGIKKVYLMQNGMDAVEAYREYEPDLVLLDINMNVMNGLDAFMVAPSINGVMSQRLVGRICESCKEAYMPSDEVLLKYFDPGTFRNVTLYRGRGCGSCHMTGFSGRVAIHEVLEISEDVRSMISNSEPIYKLQQAAKEIGCMSLRQDALKKAILGLTTIEEVERTTVPEYAI